MSLSERMWPPEPWVLLWGHTWMPKPAARLVSGRGLAVRTRDPLMYLLNHAQEGGWLSRGGVAGSSALWSLVSLWSHLFCHGQSVICWTPSTHGHLKLLWVGRVIFCMSCGLNIRFLIVQHRGPFCVMSFTSFSQLPSYSSSRTLQYNCCLLNIM